MRTPGGHAPIAAALVAACGCSFVSVRHPPPSPVPPDAPLECTQSRLPPTLDTVGAIVVPVVGLFTWGLCNVLSSMQSWSSDSGNLRCGPVLVGTLVSTAAYGGSAAYGFHATAECRRFVEQRRAGAPRPGTPP